MLSIILSHVITSCFGITKCYGINNESYKSFESYSVFLQVLLGEGYYADRTSKQTTEILKRRGNSLESQVDSLKAVVQDLKVVASFFDATAAEAAVSLIYGNWYYLICTCMIFGQEHPCIPSKF